MKEKRQFQNRLISLALAILFVLLPTNSLMTTAQIFSGSYSNSDLSEDSTFVLSKSNVQIGDDYNPEMHYGRRFYKKIRGYKRRRNGGYNRSYTAKKAYCRSYDFDRN